MGVAAGRSRRNRREVIEEVLVAAVGHELAGHGDHAVWTCLKGPGGCYRVGGLVALVGRDDAADLGKVGVAMACSAPGGSGVGDEGGALLEGAIDEAVVGALAEDAGAGPRVQSRGVAAAAAHACRRRRLCGADAAGHMAATTRGPWRSRFPVLVCGRGAGVLPTRAGM